ncbi:hypothetical protein QYE76_037725 [Lolium multiflorum]|uniref:RNase H type-1 domain-containing protein n=1 Tax=Lolium multiflorum TaxID=4521 RepID=A0AAD8VE27_LOLMU|nr:hypothetical protein QYE76_037725 [Lolium multiflorum]
MEVNEKMMDNKGKGLLYPSQSVTPIPNEESTWRPPPVGSLLASVDAGWDAFSKKAGLGAVVRDEKGGVVKSSWSHIQYCASAEEAEARACLEGLKHLIDIQRFPSTVETDCQRVVQAAYSLVPDRSASWSIYSEIQDLLRTNPMLGLKKIDRSSNQVAHGLAQLGKRESSGVLSESVPIGLSALIANDCKNCVL